MYISQELINTVYFVLLDFQAMLYGLVFNRIVYLGLGL